MTTAQIIAFAFGVGIFAGVAIGVVIDATIQRHTAPMTTATNQYPTTVEGWRQHLRELR